MDTTETEAKPFPTLVLRSRLAVVALTAMWAGIFATPVVQLTGSTESGWERPLGHVLGLAGLVVVVRTTRACLRIQDSGVTVRNTWRTRSWTWDEVGEIGWDSPAWNRFAGPIGALSICALNDPYPHTASGTASETGRLQEYAATLDPVLAAHGITNGILHDYTARSRWLDDPRSRRAARWQLVQEGPGTRREGL